RSMHSTLKFIAPGSIAEQAREGGLNFTLSIGKRASGLLHNSMRELLCTHRQILGYVIKNLRTIMGCTTSPFARCVCGFDGVANVLTVPLTNFTNNSPIGTIDGTTIARIGPCLLAANKHFWSAIYGRQNKQIAL